MATLKNLIDETTNIKNELKTCYTNLKNNLVSKGVVVASSDKISNLINKTSSLYNIQNVVAGTKLRLLDDSTVYGGVIDEKINTLTYNLQDAQSLRLSCYIKYYNASGTITFKVNHIRDASIINTYEIKGTYASYQLKSIDITNVKKNDRLEFVVTSKHASCAVKDIILSCDLEII